MIGYLVLNVTIGMIMSKRQERASTMSQEKKYFKMCIRDRRPAASS